MTNDEILARISELVAEEDQLRGKGHALTEADRDRLHDAEVNLDRLWDLLRQRDALRRAGKNPDAAVERGPGEVESYLQ